MATQTDLEYYLHLLLDDFDSGCYIDEIEYLPNDQILVRYLYKGMPDKRPFDMKSLSRIVDYLKANRIDDFDEVYNYMNGDEAVPDDFTVPSEATHNRPLFEFESIGSALVSFGWDEPGSYQFPRGKVWWFNGDFAGTTDKQVFEVASCNLIKPEGYGEIQRGEMGFITLPDGTRIETQEVSSPYPHLCDVYVWKKSVYANGNEEQAILQLHQIEVTSTGFIIQHPNPDVDQQRQFIVDYVKQQRGVDVLDPLFHDLFFANFGGSRDKHGYSLPVKKAMEHIREMNRSKILQRTVIPITGMAGQGTPNWVYSYRLR